MANAFLEENVLLLGPLKQTVPSRVGAILWSIFPFEPPEQRAFGQTGTVLRHQRNNGNVIVTPLSQCQIQQSDRQLPFVCSIRYLHFDSPISAIPRKTVAAGDNNIPRIQTIDCKVGDTGIGTSADKPGNQIAVGMSIGLVDRNAARIDKILNVGMVFGEAVYSSLGIIHVTAAIATPGYI